MTTRKPKNNIKDFRDRMTSPSSVVVTTKNQKAKTAKKKGK